MSSKLTRDHMRQTIERYYVGCNNADKSAMRACFTADAVHYFPPGTKVRTMARSGRNRRQMGLVRR